MRDILFRGKRTDTGQWVFGQYFARDDYTVILTKKGAVYKGRNQFYHGISLTAFDVDPDTVGQYTGLTDKNGKKIFEGDILAVEQISDSIEHFESPVKCPYNVVVKWDKCSWMWETIGTARKRYLHFPEAWLFRKCKVIGNIHDNPELLEVGE